MPLRELTTGFVVQEVDWRDDPTHTEEWADRMSARHGGRKSVFWRQNYERELLRGGMPVWPMLDKAVHVQTIPNVTKSADWALFRSLDQGLRHPCCCAWVAVNKNGDRHFYRQYYATEKTIALNSKAILELTPRGEHVRLTMADPSIFHREEVELRNLADVFQQAGLTLVRADNSWTGYQWLTSGFISTLARWAVWKNDIEILRKSMNAPTLSLGDAARLGAEPAITFEPSCAGSVYSLFGQCVNLRWKDPVGDPNQRAAPEVVADVDDEGPDVVRYACQSPEVHWQPPAPRPTDDLMMRILESSAKRRRQ